MKKVDEMYVFVVEGSDGDEGIPAFMDGSMMLPLIGCDMDRVQSLTGIAQMMANASGKPMKIYKFSGAREQIGEINPQ